MAMRPYKILMMTPPHLRTIAIFGVALLLVGCPWPRGITRQCGLPKIVPILAPAQYGEPMTIGQMVTDRLDGAEVRIQCWR